MIDEEDRDERPVPVIDPDSRPFWEAAAEDRLVAQRCGECGERQLYPRRLCRHCWSRDLAFVALPGTGSVYTYTECYVAGQPGYDDETPYVVVLVDLEVPAPNPSERPVRLTSHLVDCPPADLTVGLPVAVTFRQIAMEPEIHLPVFVPAEDPDEGAADPARDADQPGDADTVDG